MISSERGFALLLTLWVLMILSVLMVTYSMAVNSNLKNASYLKDEIQASAYADGVLSLMAVNLIPPKDVQGDNSSSSGTNDNNSISSTGSGRGSSSSSGSSDKKNNSKLIKWYFKRLGKWYIDPKTWKISKDKISNTYEGGRNVTRLRIECEVIAEDGKFPLNSITKLKKMPSGSNISPLVYTNIKDFLKKKPDNTDSTDDSDDLDGIKKSDSTKSKKDSYRSFSCVAELLEVRGIEGKIYDGEIGEIGLKKMMTVFSSGKIYINNTNKKVLDLVPGLESGGAETITSKVVGGSCITSFDDLNSISNLKKAKEWLSLTPEYFRIKSKVIYYGIVHNAECVVKIDKNNIKYYLMNKG